MHAMHAMHALPAAATVPLTRHEMLGLVVPFARQKRQHDLPGSDRIGRRRVFKPVAVDARPRPGDGAQPDLGEGARPPTGLVETLQLDCHAGGASFCLSRVLAHPAGRRATLQASGPQPAALLAQGQSVAASQQLGCGPGWLIARNCAIDAINAVGAAHHSAAGPGLLTLRSGTLQLLNLPMTLTLDLMPLRGAAGDIALTSAPGVPLDLPEDLLAVLGWDWARLVAGPGRSIGPGPASGPGPGPGIGIGIGIGIGPGSGPGIGPGPRARRWTSKQRLRGGLRQRTRTAERALDRAARHLAQLLGEAPASFHTRHPGL